MPLNSKDREVLRHIEHDGLSNASSEATRIAQLAGVIKHLSMQVNNLEKKLERINDNRASACTGKEAEQIAGAAKEVLSRQA
jgi:hypothetical protein